MGDRPKIIVLDDDPTGSQTVHSCLLLLHWDVETLKVGLLDDSPILFILTNSRSRSPKDAEQVTREVCRNLKQALAQTEITNFLLVSRSDSTLRGHYPLETDAIADELGPFDAHFLVPAFFEAGRITIDSSHYIEAEGQRTPVHTTEFAQDPAFGFSSSYLPDYVSEKTQGQIPAEQVQRLLLRELRAGTRPQFKALTQNACVAVDAAQQSDLDQFAKAVLTTAALGKRFLFRSAASLLTSLANLPPQPIPAQQMAHYRPDAPDGNTPGLVLVGSYTQTTTQQLKTLLELNQTVVGIEVDLAQLKADNRQLAKLQQQLRQEVESAYHDRKTAVVYTSRTVLTFETAQERLAFSSLISQLFSAVVQQSPPISFLISKGGITSNDMLSKGLNLTQVRLLGQIIPGVSVVQTPEHHPHLPSRPIVLFPGNVGKADSLQEAYLKMLFF